MNILRGLIGGWLACNHISRFHSRRDSYALSMFPVINIENYY